MNVFLQPPPFMEKISEKEWLMPGYVPNPFTDEQQRGMLRLSTEELGPVLAGLPVDVRLKTVRDLHDLRVETRDEQAFEDEVELRRRKKAAQREADKRDADERAAYLTSEEGRAEAAQRFREATSDLEDLEDPEPLIDGFLYRDTLVRTFGPPKSLKSFVTLDMAACVSLGIPWHGNPTKQVRVLYVVAEGARGVKKRKRSWNEHHGSEMGVVFFPKAVQIADPDQMHDMISYCLVEQIGYVIYDTQARCTVGIEENDNTRMGEVVAALDVLKQQTGACVHLVHHSTGSDEGKARGATSWDGAVDTEFQVKRDKNDRESLKLITKFQKDEEEADDVELRTLKVGASLVLTDDGSSGPTGGGGGEVAPALVSEANAFYLEAVRLFGNQAVTVTDMVNDFKDRRIDRSRSAIKKAFGALEGGGALEPAGKGTAVRITQGGLVFSDGWRRRQAEKGDDQGVIEGVT